MKWNWYARLVLIAFSLSIPAFGQTNVMPSSCPVQILKFNPDGLFGPTIRVENLTGEKIVGLTFNVAISDATEHWRWAHYLNDPARPLVGFNWNKELKPNSASTLTWSNRAFNLEHGGGGAFVLTSVLFEDGSSWEELPNRASCQALWHDYHKKGIAKPVILPIRQ